METNDNVFFARFQALCKQNKTSVNAVARIIGASSGAVTAWKYGTEPRAGTVVKIAEYFGVTADYLLGIEQMPGDVLDQVDVAWYGDFQELTDEQKQTVRDMVEVMRKRRQL